jgi:hypothetical protein
MIEAYEAMAFRDPDAGETAPVCADAMLAIGD